MTDMEKALRYDDIEWKLAMLLMLSGGCDQEVTWHEGCHDHEYLLTSGPGTRGERRAEYERLSKDCMWKGCRQCECIAGGVDRRLDNIRSLTHPLVAEAYSKASADKRSFMKYRETTFKELLIQGLRDKLAFLFTLPYKIIGVIACFFVPRITVDWCVNLAKDIVKEYDEAVAAGRLFRLHRVTRRFLSGELGAQLRSVADGSRALKDCSLLVVEVLLYALVPTVCRRVEGIHAAVKGVKKRKFTALTPYLSMRLRQDKLESWIETPGSESWISEVWSSRRPFLPSLMFAFPGKSTVEWEQVSPQQERSLWYLFWVEVGSWCPLELAHMEPSSGSLGSRLTITCVQVLSIKF